MNKRKLHPVHLEDLRKSGLSDDTIREAGFESIPPSFISKEIGNHPSIKNAYRIPYPGTDGFSRQRVFYQESKTGPKYLQRKDSGNRLYIPKKARAVLGDVSVPLYITEGEKKALKACQEGLHCIGLSGLWNWSHGNKQLILDFDQIALEGRNVLIVPDNDWLKPDKLDYKKNLKRAVYELGKKLIERGAKVFVVLLPESLEKMGLDDYLIGHTVEEFLSLSRKEVLTLDQRVEKATAEELPKLLKEIAQETTESRKSLLIDRLSKRLKIGKRALHKDIKTYLPKRKELDLQPTPCASFPGLVDIVENEKSQTLFLLKGLELNLATEIEREGGVYVPPEKKQCRFALGDAEQIKQHYDTDSDHQLYWDIFKRLQEVSVLPVESYYHLVTVYVFFTYLFEHLVYFPYLWFFGQPERGKSRIAMAVTHLSYRGFYTESLNEAYIFRFADRFKGTLGLDLYEISDKAKNKNSYDLILGRFRKGLSVPRIKPDKEAFQDTDYFDCWGPTVLATNVEIPVHDPLRSRCLKVTMPEARGKYPNNNSGEALADLKNRLIAFRARNLEKKIKEIEKPVEGRLGDIMQPIFYVAQLLPSEATENLFSLIEELEGERKQSESETLAGRIVQALFELEGEVRKGQLPFERLREKVNEGIEDRYHTSPQKIGRELSSLGINRKKSCGLKVLVWEQSKLNEIFKRYLPPENNVPNIPNVPKAELTRVSERAEFSQMSLLSPEMSLSEDANREVRDKMKIMSLPENTVLATDRDERDNREEVLNPKKTKFSNPIIEIEKAQGFGAGERPSQENGGDQPEIIRIEDKEHLHEIKSLIYKNDIHHVYMDTETSGLDPHSNDLVLFQIMAGGKVFIIEVDKIGQGENSDSFYAGIQKILEDPTIIKVFHNAAFDLKFLKLHLFNNQSILFNNIFDTMIAEQLLMAGLGEKGGHSIKGFYSLKEVVKRYTDHELDKTEQTSFRKDLELNDAQVEYAADDVRYLEPVFKSQESRLMDAGLVDVARLEFSIIPAVADIELRGILLDLNKLEPLKSSLVEQKVQLEDRLRELVGRAPVNFRSSKQVKKVLSQLGYPVKSTAKKFLEKINHPFAKTLVEHRKVSNLVSSFIESLPKHINPKTGRIHPDFFQCGAETGRFSCQGPNLQQIPREQVWRSLFIAPKGYKFITADYNQIELRILAEFSHDQALINAYQTNKDLHSQTASLVFNTPLDQVTKEQRDAGKTINFELCYGRTAPLLAMKLNISVDKAERFINAYFRAYPQVKNTLQKLGMKAVKEHYSETLSGRKRYYPRADSFATEKALERQGRNTPIQGTCGDILKKAIGYISESLKAFDAHIVNLIHDEIVIEVREDQAEMVKKVVEHDMIKAGRDFLKSVPVKVEITIDQCWKKE